MSEKYLNVNADFHLRIMKKRLLIIAKSTNYISATLVWGFRKYDDLTAIVSQNKRTYQGRRQLSARSSRDTHSTGAKTFLMINLRI